jgi:XTP/dITP diphosphohydrolase
MTLCFATNNKGKLNEIRSLLSSRYTILSLEEIGSREDLPETQVTLEGNSRQKAEFIWEKYKVNCFADDTGLEVHSLNGEPGVYSARYAGPECSPEDNMTLLLKKMEGIKDRQAQFKTCITLIINGVVNQFNGVVEGEITRERRGNKGFGYDPLFKATGFDKTFAEMEMEEKNKISHRARAIRALVEFLESIKN